METKYIEQSITLYKYLFISYWIPTIFFFFIDLFLYKLGIIDKYKYISKSQKSFDIKLYYDCFKSLILHFAFTLPIYLIILIICGPYIGCFENSYNYFDQLMRSAIGIVIQDMIFFYIHRYFHQNKRLFKLIHSKHHELVNNYAMGTIHAHLIENIFLNTLSIFISPLIVGVKFNFLQIWFLVGTVMPIFSHCGYKFGGIFKDMNTKHDLHHKLFNCNFGVLGLFDYIYGTRK